MASLIGCSTHMWLCLAQTLFESDLLSGIQIPQPAKKPS